MPLMTASRDLMVLLYTTGLYCLHSSLEKPLLWIILGRGGGEEGRGEAGEGERRGGEKWKQHI